MDSRDGGGSCPLREVLNGRVTCPRAPAPSPPGTRSPAGTPSSPASETAPGATPEQLIAAAHASCFSMALSNILAQAGHTAESVHTDATVTLRFVDGAPTITKIALATTGRVPGIDQDTFAGHAGTAKGGCPVSRALASVPAITLEA